MAICTYKCEDCNNEFKLNIQLFQKDYVQYCPECGSDNTKKEKNSFVSDCGNGGMTPCGRINSSGCGGGCGM